MDVEEMIPWHADWWEQASHFTMILATQHNKCHKHVEGCRICMTTSAEAHIDIRARITQTFHGCSALRC